MRMQSFTAEASLYQAIRHYRTSRARPAVNSSTRTGCPIWPALREEEGEVIDVCKDDPSLCLPPPLTEPTWVGGGGDGWPPGGSGPTDGDGGGGGGDTFPADTKKMDEACNTDNALKKCGLLSPSTSR